MENEIIARISGADEWVRVVVYVTHVPYTNCAFSLLKRLLLTITLDRSSGRSSVNASELAVIGCRVLIRKKLFSLSVCLRWRSCRDRVDTGSPVRLIPHGRDLAHEDTSADVPTQIQNLKLGSVSLAFEMTLKFMLFLQSNFA